MSIVQDNQSSELKARNPLILLRHLLDGKEWEYEGQTYVMGDDYELCVKAWEINSST
jgi:hypothetical protein